jgi:hypothetical protein
MAITAQQRAQRQQSIGGSEWAMALGNSKWGDALRLYLIKRGLVVIEESDRMEMGQYMEPVLLQWYLDSTGAQDLGRQVFLRHPEHTFLTGNLDLYVGDGEKEWIVDAKNAGFRAALEWGEPGTDAIPFDALFQAHAYLFLRPNATKVDFVVLRGMHWPPVIYTVARDEAHEDIVDAALPVLSALWNEHIVPQIPPAPDFASEFALGGMKTLFPPQPEKAAPVALAPQVLVGETFVPTRELAEAYDLLGKIEKESGRRRKLVEAAIRGALANQRAGEIDGIVIDRIYNKGGERPATTIAPYDYLKLKFPADHAPKLTSERIAALLPEGEIVNA